MAGKSKGPLDPLFYVKRLAEQRLRLAEKRAALGIRMAEARLRGETLRFLRELEQWQRDAARGRPAGPPPKPFGGRRPRPDEGGEPIPAIPRPKPTPLTGGAAAPLDPERRRTADAVAGKRGRRGKLPTEAESRLNL